ncbi:hypothetical protein B0C58_004782 [Salmonella enterica subsp. enterica serovar Oranienburg]|nr:hypothetical protein [Salmonella enterica subsp. enterica serovar Oranienburg]
MRFFVFSIRGIWLVLSVVILSLSLFRISQLHSSNDVSELISIMVYGMVLISFPIGMIFAIILSLFFFIFDFISPVVDDKYFFAVIIWGWFLLSGYIQWFFLTDKIINKVT